ncbi:MAG: acetyl-CoA carboxylase biotin carboxyl carrier protein [Nitrospinae bacterium]|nr:acetyl-CoA carboxylase biotin carboxyl carrier protein [Nitrospinota bacterium]
MDIEELKKLIKLVEKSEIREIELEEDGKKIRISKGEGGSISIPMPMHYAPAPQPHHVIPPAQIQSAVEAAVAEDDKSHHVKSPMVGTFYRASAEGAEPYAKEGDVVSKGQTLCIIEAMKLMNEIESDISGRVVKIMPENGSPVEYGETLFKIEPM